jgi:hypothetical protein
MGLHCMKFISGLGVIIRLACITLSPRRRRYFKPCIDDLNQAVIKVCLWQVSPDVLKAGRPTVVD